MISNLVIIAFVALFFYGFFSVGRSLYRSYRFAKARDERFHNLLSQLPRKGFGLLSPDSPDQEEVRLLLDRYYVIRNTRHPILELKATSAYRGAIETFPAFFLMTYEKISLFGASIGSGQRSGPSEFRGAMFAVEMPLAFPGRTMVYRRPAPGESDYWDWFADKPILGSRAYDIEEGLEADFSQELAVRSTDRTVTLPRPLQAFLVKNKDLFANTVERSSALVFDEHGWGYVSDRIPYDEELLNNLMVFQKELTGVLQEFVR